MEEIFFLSDNQPLVKNIISSLNIPESQIIYLESFEQEYLFHDWITNSFKNKGIKKLIVPISIPTNENFNSEGLKIGLHLRLNYELTIEERCIPIIFLSDLSLEILASKGNFDSDVNPQYLFFTKGVYRSTFDPNEIIKKIETSESFSNEEYFSDVLQKLKLTQKESHGSHSISNAWGCYKLGQVAGVGDEIFNLPSISSYLKTLYAKYLICVNNSFHQGKYFDLNPVKCEGKKILYIDDQSDEGWTFLIKKIFKNSADGFISIDSGKYKNNETKIFHDFEGFYNECKNQIGKAWDLIIIDLRLHPEMEDIDNEKINPSSFSGYKLIDEFLNVNKGYQIIVLTASNKIWNIYAALERGAQSFYIKESPQFNYPIKETNSQYDKFKKDSSDCFKKSYLRDIWSEKISISDKLKSSQYSTDFTLAIINQMDIAFQMVLTAKTETQFAYAFVTLYMIIEIINNHFVNRKVNGRWEIDNNEELCAWSYVENKYEPYTIDNSNTKIDKVEGSKPPEWQKFAGIYFQKWNQEDPTFIQSVYFSIRKRNGFIHNDRTILDQKDRKGKYLNRDIFSDEGFKGLFEIIKKILEFL